VQPAARLDYSAAAYSWSAGECVQDYVREWHLTHVVGKRVSVPVASYIVYTVLPVQGKSPENTGEAW
jgi:hypothetical protein